MKALVAATPATAKTVAHRYPMSGPVFAGDRVAWGALSPNGALKVVLGVPGREPVLAFRIAPPTDRETDRTISGLAASATAFAARVDTSTVVEQHRDVIVESGIDTLIGGPWRAGGILSGCLPERGDRSCEPQCHSLSATAVDGDRVAYLSDLALAGRYLAWIRADDEELVVYDLERGAIVRRVTADQLGGRLGPLDLLADGTLAFDITRELRSRVAWLSVGAPGVHVLARRAGGPLAIAAGRILYTQRPRRWFRERLLVQSLSGGPARRLMQYTKRHRPVGSVDLDATRAVWAVYPIRLGGERRGLARIVLRSL